MSEPLYYAEGNTVWKRPIRTTMPGGIVHCELGFPVCTMSDIVGDSAAEVVTSLMNAGDRALSAVDPEDDGDGETRP